MAVITIHGPLGAGAVSIGQIVAESLEINFYDRLIFTQAARLIGTPVGAVIAKEQRVDRFRDRLGRFLQTMLERSAMSGVSGEPYFGRGIENLPPETFMEMMGEGNSANRNIDDKTFLEATAKVVKDIYEEGNAVIVGRGANAILADLPDAYHVGLIAPLEVRVHTLMQRGELQPGRSGKLWRRAGEGARELLPALLQLQSLRPDPLPDDAEHGQDVERNGRERHRPCSSRNVCACRVACFVGPTDPTTRDEADQRLLVR